MRLYLTLLPSLLLLLSQTGCGRSEANAHPDDHHLEHFVPHHKPANFADAIEEIEHRCTHLAAHAGHGHEDEPDEFQELLDIVDWIPELAADSDLNEHDWNQAVGAGHTMAQQLAARKSQNGDLNLKGLSEAIAAELNELRTLISKAGKPEPEIHHEHEHEHEHDE